MIDGCRIVTQPATEVITRAEAKKQLRLNPADSHEDDLIDSLITTARQTCESLCRRSFINTTWRYTFDNFPGGCSRNEDQIFLPVAPLVSITSIKYYDTASVETTLDSTAYFVDTNGEPGRVAPVYGTIWPVIISIPNAVQIDFVAGYGALASDVPEGLKSAIKLLLTHLYKNREPIIIGTIASKLGLSFQYMLAPYRLLELE